MKKFVKYLLVVCLMIPFAFMFSGCSQNDPANVMTMSVNPEVSFVLDANNKVVSVKYENEDAGVIYADVNFVGKDVDTLIQLFIERATISGHVDLSGDEVTITVNGKTDADVNALRQKAKEQVKKGFNSLGIEDGEQIHHKSLSNAIERAHTLCLYNGESADAFKKKVNDFFEEHSFSSEDEFVILADVIGGSPLTTFLSVFSERGLMNKGVVLGGMNFTMALTATVSLDTMSKEDIAKNALDEARQALKQYEVTPENSTDDDDDI